MVVLIGVFLFLKYLNNILLQISIIWKVISLSNYIALSISIEKVEIYSTYCQ